MGGNCNCVGPSPRGQRLKRPGVVRRQHEKGPSEIQQGDHDMLRRWNRSAKGSKQMLVKTSRAEVRRPRLALAVFAHSAIHCLQ